MTCIVEEAVRLAATPFHRDTSCPSPEEAIVTETSLRENLFTGGIIAAGTGVATVSATQLIMAVSWTVKFFKSEERNAGY